jgi:protein-tyrosine-phosphatase
MAEALVRAALPAKSPWRVTSAGLAACPGEPASDGAVQALAEIGCDLRGHSAQAVRAELMRGASAIVALTRAHAQQLVALDPSARDRVYVLRAFDPDAAGDDDVADPFCGGLDDYRRCRDVIRRAVPGLIRFLNQSDPAAS